ncbi:MAG: hypothetical protein JSS95_09125 [Acidobacteria bacterium]|nr:hypothetical protein [Acidobacteriota bacterium]
MRIGAISRAQILAHVLYVLATMQLASFYLVSTHPYLRFWDYMRGAERNPFQERVLPVALLYPLVHSRAITAVFEHLRGLFLPIQRGAYFVVCFFALCIAGFFVMKLYDALSPSRKLWFAVYPAFLYVTLWSYVVIVQQPFFYPYDVLSLMFFTAGVYYIYTRQYWPLFLTVLIGTVNRETTLFLIVIYMIDSCSRDTSLSRALWRRLDLRMMPWVRVAMLTAVWLTIRIALHHIFAANNNAEDAIHVRDNLEKLMPKHWPAVLNICGYVLPVVLVCRKKIAPARFANYLLVMPVWFAIMFVKGILVETRIYGELSGFTAVAAVLLLERYAMQGEREEERESVMSAV